LSEPEPLPQRWESAPAIVAWILSLHPDNCQIIAGYIDARQATFFGTHSMPQY